jgi:acyl carrier protein
LRACEQAAAASSVACDPNATPDKFLRKAGRRAQKAILREDLRAALAVLVGSDSEMAMSTSSVSRVRPIDETVAVKVRALIAEHLGVDAKRVSNEAHFRKDLGADWLDRLELVIAIEDRFGVEIVDEVAERIEAVGDLVHVVETQPLH